MDWSRVEVLKYVIGMEQISRRTQRTLAHLTKAVKTIKKNIARTKCSHCKQRMRPKPVKDKANPAKRLARVSGAPPTPVSETVAMDVTTNSIPMPKLIPETLITTGPPPSRMPRLSREDELSDVVVTNPGVVKQIVSSPKKVVQKLLTSPEKVVTSHEVVRKFVPEGQQTTPAPPPAPAMGYMTRAFLNKQNGDSGIDMDEDQCSVSIKVSCWLQDTSTEPSPDLEKEMEVVASKLGNTPLQIGMATKMERFFDTIVREDDDDDSLSMDEYITFSRNE